MVQGAAQSCTITCALACPGGLSLLPYVLPRPGLSSFVRPPFDNRFEAVRKMRLCVSEGCASCSVIGVPTQMRVVPKFRPFLITLVRQLQLGLAESNLTVITDVGFLCLLHSKVNAIVAFAGPTPHPMISLRGEPSLLVRVCV